MLKNIIILMLEEIESVREVSLQICTFITDIMYCICSRNKL